MAPRVGNRLCAYVCVYEERWTLQGDAETHANEAELFNLPD